MSKRYPTLLFANALEASSEVSSYPEPFASQMRGRVKRRLGDAFGLSSIGINFTTLAPCAVSALRHSHEADEEFVYVISGNPTLITDDGEFPMKPGYCVGFRAGTSISHQIRNDTEVEVDILEIGTRSKMDVINYPEHDLVGKVHNGKIHFLHKDRTPY